MKHYIAIVGALWFDKVNGNTYHNTKIVDLTTGETYYTGYSYGYGDSYVYDSYYFIEKKLKIYNYYLRDLGSFYITKTKCKKGLF